MMFVSPEMDFRTLEYIKKSMSLEELETAEYEGVFDLLKADRSHLHPKLVLCQGPNGPYYAKRLVSDEQNVKHARTKKAELEEKKITIRYNLADDIAKYSGRRLTDVYAEEGREGVVRALGARYAEESGGAEKVNRARLLSMYGETDTYTPEAAAMAMKLWTQESFPYPGTEDMDEDELREWYEDEGYSIQGVNESGRIWGCSLMRASNSQPLNSESETEVLAAVGNSIVQDVMDHKGTVHDGALYRGVAMDAQFVYDVIREGRVYMGGTSSFTSDESVARRFSEYSSIWEDEDALGVKMVYVIDEVPDATSFRVPESKYADEEEYLVKGDKPYEVQKITRSHYGWDSFLQRNANKEEEIDEDIDPEEIAWTNDTFYVYLKAER